MSDTEILHDGKWCPDCQVRGVIWECLGGHRGRRKRVYKCPACETRWQFNA